MAGLVVLILDPMHNKAIVGLIDEVGRTRDIIQVGGLSAPVLHLPGVRHKPDMDVVVLSKALDLGQHLTHVLRLIHIARPLMVQLIVWVNHQPMDAIPVVEGGQRAGG